MTSVLIKRRNLETDTQRGKIPANMKEEIGVMNLQAKEHQKVPANHQNLGERHGTDSPT